MPAKLLQQPDHKHILDLVGIGFGPACLAVAVALYDELEDRATRGSALLSPHIRFLEQQNAFAWHAGMLLPGTKMQISFIKDLATIRNPRSHFTFLNYLKQHNRLVQFCNLDTFLPLRLEFEDYLRWCASHFAEIVEYAQHVTSVKPLKIGGSAKFNCLEVTSTNSRDSTTSTHRARNVIIAVGGRPFIPPVFSLAHPAMIHSSSYSQHIHQVLPDKNKPYKIAVVGAGQSAAEVFNDLRTRFPQSTTSLIIRDTALRPSDDSPFVNEVFNPEVVDNFYLSPPDVRSNQLRINKATNYGVVRLALLEEIHEVMYRQRLENPNADNWQHHILPCSHVVGTSESPTGQIVLKICDERLHALSTLHELTVDSVILATGYVRDVHNRILSQCNAINGSQGGTWVTERDYQVQLNRDLVDPDVSIYLQGCNELTHGLSDSLLSNLATRGGEIVDSIFGETFAKSDANGARKDHYLRNGFDGCRKGRPFKSDTEALTMK